MSYKFKKITVIHLRLLLTRNAKLDKLKIENIGYQTRSAKFKKIFIPQLVMLNLRKYSFSNSGKCRCFNPKKYSFPNSRWLYLNSVSCVLFLLVDDCILIFVLVNSLLILYGCVFEFFFFAYIWPPQLEILGSSLSIPIKL